MGDVSEDLKLVLQRHRADVYSDVWACPECIDGTMEGEIETGFDLVTCEDCGHECQAREMVFVCGDIATIVDAYESERARAEAAEAELAALRERVRGVADYLRERADVQRAAGFPENEYECNVARGFVEAVLEPEGADDGQ